jgi:hypothetical protein
LKLKPILKFGVILGGVGKALGESNLIEFISQFSELRCGGYLFLSEFCYWKIKQITKIGFGRKNELSPRPQSMCSHLNQRHRLHE